MSQLSFENYGFAHAGRWLVRDLWLQTPATGVMQVEGAPVALELMGRILARYTLPEVASWGSLTLGGVDLRVSPPAAFIGDTFVGCVSEWLLATAAPVTQMRLLSSPPVDREGYARSLLAASGLGALQPAEPCEALSPGMWMRLQLASAAIQRRSVVWVESATLAQAGAELPEVLSAMEKLAQGALVLVAGRADERWQVLTLPEVPPQRATAAANLLSARGLPGFRWILPGLLAGMARPGSGLCSLEEDVESLRAIGAAVVVTLEEALVNEEALRAAGLEVWHLPIVDMKAPSVTEARRIARRAAERLARGQLVVFHCKGGVGRTGTMLACSLMARGQSAAGALEIVRQQNPHYVQSREQLDMLQHYREVQA